MKLKLALIVPEAIELTSHARKIAAAAPDAKVVFKTNLA
jgi:hypothetical protein